MGNIRDLWTRVNPQTYIALAICFSGACGYFLCQWVDTYRLTAMDAACQHEKEAVVAAFGDASRQRDARIAELANLLADQTALLKSIKLTGQQARNAAAKAAATKPVVVQPQVIFQPIPVPASTPVAPIESPFRKR